MKKTWVDPRIEVQQFVPDEYVAACVQGTLACALPNDPYEIDGGATYQSGGVTTFNNLIDPSRYLGDTGLSIAADNNDHGICGTAAPISFDSETLSGYEIENGQIALNRRIYGIRGYTGGTGEFKVVWNSTDGAGIYNHYGLLNVTAIDNNNANAS